MKVSENLKTVQTRIENTCRRINRDSAGITLIAVAKSQSIEKIREAVQAGITDIGENYAQELVQHQDAMVKSGWLVDRGPPASATALPGDGGETGPALTHWHFIGHLQRNKVKKIIDHVTLIHSVDSLELAQEINTQAKKIGKEQKILLEINLAQEGSKTGLALSTELFDLISHANKFDSLLLTGLMVIPPFDENLEKIRPFFRRLREIRDEINSRKLYKNGLTELSMGMTHDFEIAIEEGATMVRIGTGIFGERPPS